MYASYICMGRFRKKEDLELNSLFLCVSGTAGTIL